MPAIPESEYRTFAGNPGAVTKELIVKHHGTAGYRDFCRWFGIGTCPVLDDGTAGIYVSDYLAWLDGRPNDD